MPETHRRPREGVTEEIKQDCRNGKRERKTNNNNDLMQCEMEDTGLFAICLMISDLIWAARIFRLFIIKGEMTVKIRKPVGCESR
jgi:hypothetical protein